MKSNQDQFFEQVTAALASGSFIGVLLTKVVDAARAPRRVSASVKQIRGQRMLQLLSEEETRHTTRNYPVPEGVSELVALCGRVFKHAILYTSEGDLVLRYNRKMHAQLSRSKASKTLPASLDHDRRRPRTVNPEASPYLHLLGVTTREGGIARSMEDKFRQINRYIETFEAVYRKSGLAAQPTLRIADMGCGKGYLTFALYDFLHSRKGIDCVITGVECRQELVDACNAIAAKVHFDKLAFIKGRVEHYHPTELDVLIALHACDTATDDAIAAGVEAGASIIITAPCCHKQVRREMKPPHPLSEITRHGIFMERQAELLTDTLRALLLESRGYETSVFEFIADAHTHKNVMIVATRRESPAETGAVLKRIADLKAAFGVTHHYLESRLPRLEGDERM